VYAARRRGERGTGTTTGSAARIKGSQEIAHHTETYEVATNGGAGAPWCSPTPSSPRPSPTPRAWAERSSGRETGTVVHLKIPAADLIKPKQGAEAPAAAEAG
jgi:hypothetical protein